MRRSSDGLIGSGLLLLSEALSFEVDAVGVVDEAIEDCVGDRGISDDFVPAIDGQLAGDDDRTGFISALADLEQIAGLTQLIGEVREPIPAKPGQLERYDCEYRRNGTVNLFVFLDALRPWRRVKVTDRRTNQDFAECMRELVDIDYPDAPIIRVVMDNLSTHSPGALYAAFPAPEARRVLKRLQFHHTPKHASWLNMVEIEIGVLRSQCLDRRIDDKETILAEVAAWQQRRNAEGAQIQWMFTTEKAREKLRKAYPVKES